MAVQTQSDFVSFTGDQANLPSDDRRARNELVDFAANGDLAQKSMPSMTARSEDGSCASTRHWAAMLGDVCPTGKDQQASASPEQDWETLLGDARRARNEPVDFAANG